MTDLERAIITAIDDRVAQHDAEVEVLIAAMRSSLSDLMANQASLQRDREKARAVCGDVSRALVAESMHHEHGMKVRLLKMSHRLNAIANPDWVKP